MKSKIKKNLLLIISCVIAFVIGFYISMSLVTVYTTDKIIMVIVSILIGIALSFNTGKKVLEKMRKREREEFNRRIKYIAQTKVCEFCMSEIKVTRESQNIPNEKGEEDFIVTEVYSCEKCQYEVCNNHLYKHDEKQKEYFYCDIRKTGNIEPRKLEKGNLFSALCILDILDNKQKEKK